MIHRALAALALGGSLFIILPVFFRLLTHADLLKFPRKPCNATVQPSLQIKATCPFMSCVVWHSFWTTGARQPGLNFTQPARLIRRVAIAALHLRALVSTGTYLEQEKMGYRPCPQVPTSRLQRRMGWKTRSLVTR